MVVPGCLLYPLPFLWMVRAKLARSNNPDSFLLKEAWSRAKGLSRSPAGWFWTGVTLKLNQKGPSDLVTRWVARLIWSTQNCPLTICLVICLFGWTTEFYRNVYRDSFGTGMYLKWFGITRSFNNVRLTRHNDQHISGTYFFDHHEVTLSILIGILTTRYIYIYISLYDRVFSR